MDASPRRYATFADLEPYCHRVASAVGLMCAEIFGYREQAVLDYARDLGVALQLTNILRDVAVDYRRGRFYLPLEDLARFGCTEADIAREVEQARPRRAERRTSAPCSSTRRRARACSSRARCARCRSRTRRGSSPPRSCARSTSSCCARIEAADFDVFTSRDPRAAARAGATRAAVVVDARRSSRRLGRSPRMDELSADVVVIGAGFAGLERRGPSRRRRPARRRRRGSAAARRARHRVHRSRDRRARGQRPARAVRLLSRDVRVSRSPRHARARAASAAAVADDGGRDGATVRR